MGNCNVMYPTSLKTCSRHNDSQSCLIDVTYRRYRILRSALRYQAHNDVANYPWLGMPTPTLAPSVAAS